MEETGLLDPNLYNFLCGQRKQTKRAISFLGRRVYILVWSKADCAGWPAWLWCSWAQDVAGRQKCQIVSADQVRLQIWGSLQKANQARDHKRVFDIKKLRKALQEGNVAVADATNLYPYAREPLYRLAKETVSKAKIVFFSNRAQALRQNRLREEDAVVPEEAMQRLGRLLPDLEEQLRAEVKTHR